jgi:hypothetical protein
MILWEPKMLLDLRQQLQGANWCGLIGQVM